MSPSSVSFFKAFDGYPACEVITKFMGWVHHTVLIASLLMLIQPSRPLCAQAVKEASNQWSGLDQ